MGDAADAYPQMIIAGDRNIGTSTQGAPAVSMFTASAPNGWVGSVWWAWTANDIHLKTGNLGLTDGSVQTTTIAAMQAAFNTATNGLGKPPIGITSRIDKGAFRLITTRHSKGGLVLLLPPALFSQIGNPPGLFFSSLCRGLTINTGVAPGIPPTRAACGFASMFNVENRRKFKARPSAPPSASPAPAANAPSRGNNWNRPTGMLQRQQR